MNLQCLRRFPELVILSRRGEGSLVTSPRCELAISLMSPKILRSHSAPTDPLLLRALPQDDKSSSARMNPGRSFAAAQDDNACFMGLKRLGAVLLLCVAGGVASGGGGGAVSEGTTEVPEVVVDGGTAGSATDGVEDVGVGLSAPGCDAGGAF